MNNQVYRISLFHTIIRKIIPSVLVYASVSQASQYTKGVEDRIHEADAIVAGQAIMISELMPTVASTGMVEARIDVTHVLKGDNIPNAIYFHTHYSPLGFSRSTNRYFSADDEKHSRLMESFPYGLGYPAIFFLRYNQDGTWAPFYSYIDNDMGNIRQAIESIMQSESLRLTDDIVSTLLDSKHDILVRKYAIRAVMRHDNTWAGRSSILLASLGGLNIDDETYSYLVACVAAFLRNEVPATNYEGLDLLISLIKKAPSVEALDFAVQEIYKVKESYRHNHYMAKKLHSALIEMRSMYQDDHNASFILPDSDRKLIEGIGLVDINN